MFPPNKFSNSTFQQNAAPRQVPPILPFQQNSYRAPNDPRQSHVTQSHDTGYATGSTPGSQSNTSTSTVNQYRPGNESQIMHVNPPPPFMRFERPEYSVPTPGQAPPHYQGGPPPNIANFSGFPPVQNMTGIPPPQMQNVPFGIPPPPPFAQMNNFQTVPPNMPHMTNFQPGRPPPSYNIQPFTHDFDQPSTHVNIERPSDRMNIQPMNHITSANDLNFSKESRQSFKIKPYDDYSDNLDNEDDSKFDKYQREKDQNWIETFLRQKGKWKATNLSLNESTSSCKFKIHEVQQAFHQSIVELAKLQHQFRSMESILTTTDDHVWEAEKSLTEEYRDKCVELHGFLDNADMMDELKRKVEVRNKKRARLKRRRREAQEEIKMAAELREKKHQQLDEWINKTVQIAEDEKQKAELKKSADSTLSSVRKKISDAKKTQEVLKALQKLRKTRRTTAINQGRYASDVYDANFDKQMGDLTKLMISQQKMYEAEEKTLKVMLEAAEEETRERDKEIKIQKEKARARLEKKLAEEKLFGKHKAVAEEDELYPFNMYYTQAEHSVDSLLQIRHEWDLHLSIPNIPGATRIPDGFILPAEPNSDVWASALK